MDSPPAKPHSWRLAGAAAAKACSAASQGIEYTGQTKAQEANPTRLFVFIYISWWFCAWRPRLTDPRAYIFSPATWTRTDEKGFIIYYWHG